MDRLQILNLTLAKLGEEEQFDDPAAPNSHTGRLLNANWDATRQLVLREHFWNFAVDPGGTTLTADATYLPAPHPGFGYRYVLPPDFIRLDLQHLAPMGLRSEVRLGGGYLYASDAGPVQLVYVADVKEPGRWDAAFAEAFACRLAAQVATRIDGMTGKRRELLQEYAQALAKAKAQDGRENPPEPIEDFEWVTARFAGGEPWPWGWY